MCEAFVRSGLDVRLVRPFYFGLLGISKKKIYDFYGITDHFAIATLPTLLSLSKPITGRAFSGLRIPFIGGATMLLSTWAYMVFSWLTGKFDEKTIIYSRNVNATNIFLQQRNRLLRKKPVKIFFETHSFSQQPKSYFDRALREADGIVTITSALKKAIVSKYGIDEKKIFVWPDGVRADRLQKEPVTRKNARELLGITTEVKNIVLYSGQLLPGKGVEVFIQAAKDLEQDVAFFIVGGTPSDRQRLIKQTGADHLKNVFFVGFVPPHKVALYQAAADVLVLPNTTGVDISDFTSPLKLFEYMAARRPIVASDLPVFSEILRHEENALIVPHSNPAALASAIKRLLNDRILAQKISQKAFEQVHQYTYENRARNILGFIERQTGWKILQ